MSATPAASSTRSAPAPRTWSAWIPRNRVNARLDPRFAALSDRQRVLLLTLEYVWKSDPYAFTSNAELAALTGWSQRKVQRVLEELEAPASSTASSPRDDRTASADGSPSPDASASSPWAASPTSPSPPRARTSIGSLIPCTVTWSGAVSPRFPSPPRPRVHD